MAEKQSWELDEGHEIAPGRTVLKALGGGHATRSIWSGTTTSSRSWWRSCCGPTDSTTRERCAALAREAEALEALAHPALLRGFGAVLDGPFPHVLVEHLEGPSLRRLIRRSGPLTLRAGAAAGPQRGRGGPLHGTPRATSTSTSSPTTSSSGSRRALIDFSLVRSFERAARHQRAGWARAPTCRPSSAPRAWRARSARLRRVGARGHALPRDSGRDSRSQPRERGPRPAARGALPSARGGRAPVAGARAGRACRRRCSPAWSATRPTAPARRRSRSCWSRSWRRCRRSCGWAAAARVREFSRAGVFQGHERAPSLHVPAARRGPRRRLRGTLARAPCCRARGRPDPAGGEPDLRVRVARLDRAALEGRGRGRLARQRRRTTAAPAAGTTTRTPRPRTTPRRTRPTATTPAPAAATTPARTTTPRPPTAPAPRRAATRTRAARTPASRPTARPTPTTRPASPSARRARATRPAATPTPAHDPDSGHSTRGDSEKADDTGKTEAR